MADRVSLSEMEALAMAGKAQGSSGAVKVHTLTVTVRSLLALADEAERKGQQLRSLGVEGLTLAANAYVGMAERIRSTITDRIDIEE